MQLLPDGAQVVFADGLELGHRIGVHRRGAIHWLRRLALGGVVRKAALRVSPCGMPPPRA